MAITMTKQTNAGQIISCRGCSELVFCIVCLPSSSRAQSQKIRDPRGDATGAGESSAPQHVEVQLTKNSTECPYFPLIHTNKISNSGRKIPWALLRSHFFLFLVMFPWDVSPGRTTGCFKRIFVFNAGIAQRVPVCLCLTWLPRAKITQTEHPTTVTVVLLAAHQQRYHLGDF